MSTLLLLYGIETPDADVVIPPVPVPVALTHTPGGGFGGGNLGMVKRRRRAGEVLRTADYDYWIGVEDEDIMVVLQ